MFNVFFPYFSLMVSKGRKHYKKTNWLLKLLLYCFVHCLALNKAQKAQNRLRVRSSRNKNLDQLYLKLQKFLLITFPFCWTLTFLLRITWCPFFCFDCADIFIHLYFLYFFCIFYIFVFLLTWHETHSSRHSSYGCQGGRAGRRRRGPGRSSHPWGVSPPDIITMIIIQPPHMQSEAFLT